MESSRFEEWVRRTRREIGLDVFKRASEYCYIASLGRSIAPLGDDINHRIVTLSDVLRGRLTQELGKLKTIENLSGIPRRTLYNFLNDTHGMNLSTADKLAQF